MHSCRMTLESTVVEIGKWSEDFNIVKLTSEFVDLIQFNRHNVSKMCPKGMRKVLKCKMLCVRVSATVLSDDCCGQASMVSSALLW